MNNKDIVIGILGLQGAFSKHKQTLDELEIKSKPVRFPEEIKETDALIIPGGESSTNTKLIDDMGLRDSLMSYNKPIMGTCAGMILLGEKPEDNKVQPLKKLPIECQRNAYGRQLDSFTANIDIKDLDKPFHAVFIRAPHITSINNEEVEILSTYESQPVFVKYKNVIGTSFHPELSEDTRIHEYFLNLI